MNKVRVIKDREEKEAIERMRKVASLIRYVVWFFIFYFLRALRIILCSRYDGEVRYQGFREKWMEGYHVFLLFLWGYVRWLWS